MYTPIAKTSDRIKEALRDSGMKQAELARRAELNTGALCCWLKGTYEPKQEALYRMGKVLGVSEMWLAGYDVQKERPPESRENDLTADLIRRMKKSEKYKELLEKTIKLSDEQVHVITSLIDQMLPPSGYDTEAE